MRIPFPFFHPFQSLTRGYHAAGQFCFNIESPIVGYLLNWLAQNIVLNQIRHFDCHHIMVSFDSKFSVCTFE